MGKFLAFLLLLSALVFGGNYLYKNYKGLYVANAPPSQNIVDIIEKVSQPALKPGENKTQFPLIGPDGYSISIFAKDLVNPRDLVEDPAGNILVSITSNGRVVAILGDSVETVASGLQKPHGLAFNGNKLYIAEENQVASYDYDTKTHKATNKVKIIDLPSGEGHFTRSILIKDGKIYVSTGSSCNACVESDPRRAAIWQANLDGTDFKAYATGLRNSVFMTVKPGTDELWATNMGRDLLGDDIPPETVNIIKEGANYGWPYCYGNKVTDSQINPGNSKFDCNKMQTPELSFQAHSAPLGLAFLGKDLLVSFHGSWNRSTPTGYKVVKFHNGVQEDFITGWPTAKGEVLGRPVDILVKGSDLFISDDKAGVIYRLSKI